MAILTNERPTHQRQGFSSRHHRKQQKSGLGDYDLIQGQYAAVRLIEGQDPTVPSTLSKFPKKREQIPNHEIAHRISAVLAMLGAKK